MTPPDTSLITVTLQRSLDAAGGRTRWQALRALQLDGRIHGGGLSGPYLQQLDLPGGRFTTRHTLGPASQARGFDGQRAWLQGANGEVALQDAEAAVRAALTECWLHARAWWFPERGAAEWLGLERRDDGGRSFDVLHAHPAGGQPVALWFDTATHRLDRTVQNVHGFEMARHFEDHREVEGLSLPHRIATRHGTDARQEVVIALDAVTLDPVLAANAFAVPTQALDDVRFPSGASSAAIPAELFQNHVYVMAQVNGQPLRLMLDTGGVNLLTPEAAQRAGLQCEGALEARGPGAAAASAGFTRVERMVIGDKVALERQLFRVLPLPGLDEAEGTRCDGLLGYELFKRLAVEIDYAGATVSLLAPRAYQPPAGAVRLPLNFHAHLPAVDAQLDGIGGQFWIDTGNRNELTLWSRFEQAHGFGRRHGAGEETVIGWGIGGRVMGRVARGGRLRIGRLDIEAPVLTLPGSDTGVTTAHHVAGNIGGGLLRRFVVCFDYAASAAWLAGPAAAARSDAGFSG